MEGSRSPARTLIVPLFCYTFSCSKFCFLGTPFVCVWGGGEGNEHFFYFVINSSLSFSLRCLIYKLKYLAGVVYEVYGDMNPNITYLRV